MTSFSMGRYIPYNTFVHHLDPRTKILALVLFMIAIFMGQATYAMSFLVEGVILVIAIALYSYSRMKVKVLLRSILSMWFMILFLLIVYMFTPRDASASHLAFELWGVKVYWEAFLDTARIVLRLILMVMFSLVLTATTRPLDLTDALEWYLTPFKLIGFPTHIFAMMLSLALRFIPTIMDDVDRIMKVQTSRGVDYQKGSLISKIKAMVSLIVPLFVQSFVRSDELANAMESRGYDPNGKRTRYRKLSFHLSDLIAVLLTGAFAALVMYVSIVGFDPFLAWGGLATW